MTIWSGLAGSRRSRAGLEDDKSRMGQGEDILAAKTTADLALAQPPIGAINMWGADTDPADGTWLICDGRTLAKADYPELFSIYSSTWNTGGEGVDEFRIPDFRSRNPVGAGQGSGLSNRDLASTFGAENHTLTTAQMPIHNHGASGGLHGHGILSQTGHNHSYNAVSSVVTQFQYAIGGATAASVVTTAAQATGLGNANFTLSDANAPNTIANAGSGNSHNNMQPGLGVNFILRVL